VSPGAPNSTDRFLTAPVSTARRHQQFPDDSKLFKLEI